MDRFRILISGQPTIFEDVSLSFAEKFLAQHIKKFPKKSVRVEKRGGGIYKDYQHVAKEKIGNGRGSRGR